MSKLIQIILIAALCYSAMAKSMKMNHNKEHVSKASSTTRDVGVPLNMTEWDENPCDTTRNFNYYMAFPNDPSRYIQCDPWGTGTIRECIEGYVWNVWALRCDLPENVHNMTIEVPHRVFNCSMTEQECLNGGVCTESPLGGDRCVCEPDWTGPNCETRVDFNDLTHDILNGTFSIHEYRERLSAMNISAYVSQYERYKDQLDNQTYTELMKYISMYDEHEVRYDTLINNLVETILEDIYPDAAYLSSFNCSAISVVELVQLIPNLMSYSKYSLERYQDVFSKYQEVLIRLGDYLNSTRNSHPTLKFEAIQYSKLTTIFMNQTLAMLNQSSSMGSLLENSQETQHQMTEEQVRESLRTQFNQTLTATMALYKSLEGFAEDVRMMVENGTQDIYSLTIDQSHLNGTEEVYTMLKEISSSSVQIWDSLVNYGFWYITSTMTTTAEQLDRVIAEEMISDSISDMEDIPVLENSSTVV